MIVNSHLSPHSGCSIVVVCTHGVRVVRVRFPAPRPKQKARTDRAFCLPSRPYRQDHDQSGGDDDKKTKQELIEGGIEHAGILPRPLIGEERRGALSLKVGFDRIYPIQGRLDIRDRLIASAESV